MSDTIMAGATKLKILQCRGCGVWFAIPEIMHTRCFEDGGHWHCPNGHSWGWDVGNKERENLRRERDLLKQQIAQKDDEIAEERRRSAAFRGEATKIKNRVKHGVCPCCNRSFQNLLRHMENKHPDFDPKVIHIDRSVKKSA